MAQIQIENLTFQYAMAQTPALQNINLEVNRGEFIVLCGKSGCGKTTLMRFLKTALWQAGERKGNVFIDGVDIRKIPEKVQAQKIGFVMQNPEHQIVTDKVWHELAFGLENLGYRPEEIRLRVAEMSEYFGISHWYDRTIRELSGGQKQLLNLAAVMAMHPEIMILDEPTSALDPIAAQNFFNTLKKINEDLGITIILSEHRLNQVIPMADRVVVLEEGKICECDVPKKMAKNLFDREEFKFMPVATAIYKEAVGKNNVYNPENIPLTVSEGRKWAEQTVCGEETLEKCIEKKQEKKYVHAGRTSKNEQSGVSVSVKNAWFRYDKNGADIIKDLNFTAFKGEILCILGGNGAGKTTMLSLLAKIQEPYRGKIKTEGCVAVLPQNVQCLFLYDTVGEELGESESRMMNDVIEKMGFLKYYNRHPYDLSGGEQQKLGLAKILLANPDIILLDEPTKGIDNIYKEELGKILIELARMGKTIIMVSHDVEFCAEYGERCGLFFNGNITAVNNTKEFFRANHFYTTAAHKMFRRLSDEIVTKEEAVCYCKADTITQ